MTFGPYHYVPVLKVKRGEKKALAAIDPALRRHVTPLMEIVELQGKKTVDGHLATSFGDLRSNLQGYDRCLLDVRELEAQGSVAAEAAFARASDEAISFTPVTGLSRTADVAAALRHGQTSGIGIRLTRQEYESGRLASDLDEFLLVNDLGPDRIDLIVDLGSVEDLILAGVMTLAKAFLKDVPRKEQWRTLTIVSSAFPKSMSVVERNSSARVERSDWLAWRDGLYSDRDQIERLPTFGDCAIQHPAGVEGFDPRYMQASAAIRYSVVEDWLLVKGVGTRSRRLTEQFPQLATQLVYGQLQGDFLGWEHCAGCRMAKDAADGVSGLGSAEVWRRIGTIHHITTVVQDVLALPR